MSRLFVINVEKTGLEKEIDMKWIVKNVNNRWYVYLENKYCKTKEPVCYGSSLTESSARMAAKRLNNPTHKENLNVKKAD